jgi:hypothetical protein
VGDFCVDGGENNFVRSGKSARFRSFSSSNDIGVLRKSIVFSNEFDRVFGGLVLVNIFELSAFRNIERDGRLVLLIELSGV